MVHLTQPEKFKKNTLTGIVLTTQEATFKVQLDRDGRVHLTWPEESVFPHRQSDTASYRTKTLTSLIAPFWIPSGLKSQYYLTGKMILQATEQ